MDKTVIEGVASKLRKLVEERYSKYVVYVYLFGSAVEGKLLGKAMWM